MPPPLRVGLAGLGTVGAGVFRLLQGSADLVAVRAGRPVAVAAVSARDRARDRGLDLAAVRWHDNPLALASDPAVDVVVELIGGANGVAHALAVAALDAGKPVVTANKAMLATHAAALAARAGHGGVLAFEAAAGGGMPVVKLLREGLAANTISKIAAILNGTCNYILSTMAAGGGRRFAGVLAEAQALGYAEAEPSFDIDGHDTAQKLALLAALAFGAPVPLSFPVDGIRGVTALDHAFARELGYAIKLLGVARREAGGLACFVGPCLVPAGSALASIEGVVNAAVIEASHAGRIVLSGPGAGACPTASAVLADLIDIARNRAAPLWDPGSPAALVPAGHTPGAFFLRLSVLDRAGVIAEVAAALRDSGVSLQSMLQHGRAPGEPVPVVLTTHEARLRQMTEALRAIERMEALTAKPLLLRIEHD